MRITSYLLPALVAGTLILASCNKKGVTLTDTNAKGEVPQLGNLYFRFSNSMVNDSLLNNWDSTEYISFEPSIPGRFRWQGPDELVFSPAQPLKPATTYKAKIKGSVLRFSSFDKVRGAGDISFHTAALTLINSQVYWLGESSTSAVPQADLYFNYPINPEDLKDKLKLEVEGKTIDYTLVNASPSARISIRLNGLKTEDRELEAEYEIAKGLKTEHSNQPTDEKIKGSLNISSPFVLSILELQADHDGSEGIVRVTTSQQLSAENIRTVLKFEPEVAYTVEAQDYGFLLRSDKFDTERSYAVNIQKGLRGKIGGVLKEDFSGNVAFGELEAGLAFTNSKAVYLSGKGSGNIEVKITNVAKIKVIISRIYESNLLAAQRYGYEPREKSSGPEYSSYEYEDEYYGRSYSDAMLGDVIYEKEIDTRSLPKSKSGQLLNIKQFEERLGDFKGIYHVLVRSSEDYWVRDSRFISMSDIGLITKEGSEKIYVFANSIKSAEAVSGVNVSVYATNNQLIGTGSTNSDGVAEVKYVKNEFTGFKPAMVIAKTAEDFNYLPFANTGVNTSRFDVGGRRSNPSGLEAFIYSERDVYRPGEKINYSVILRDAAMNVPGDVPVKLKFLLPNGKELKEARRTLNAEGSLEGNLEIPTSAITGSYTMEVYSTTDVLLASRNFSVEEFVPDRIKVTAKLEKESLRAGDSSRLLINAVNFFGPPAANRKYETEIQVKQKSFAPEKYQDYDFSLANQNTFFDKEVKEGITDAAGNASFIYSVPSTYADMGLLQTSFYATVFDETGRPVSRIAKADIYTQEVFFGIKNDWFYYFPLNQAVTLSLVAVNKQGSAIAANGKLQVIKHEYRTVLTKSGSYFRYESQKEDKILVDQTLSISAGTKFSYVPRTPGDYEIRIFNNGANTYVSRSFYSYGDMGGNVNSFEVSSEGSIDIEIDKKSYVSGEKVLAHFKTPFSGRMLVTVETDHVISYKYLDVVKRDGSMELPLTVEHVPNVYITATLVKPHEMSDIPLTVAHGFKNVTVEGKDRKMNVTVEAHKAVRSKTHQKVTVKAAPGSMVTLAAVDNGVLQVTDFKTPNPYDYFYEKRALQVSSFDLYPLLFAEVRARLSSTGGDGGLDMDKRVNPIQAKRIKVVSYWGGMKKANSSGIAEFEFDVPQFSGELRLMAVAYKGQKFGAGQSEMKVADPIVLSTALPRFVSPGDTILVPVTLTNTTSGTANAKANIVLEGPLQSIGGNAQTISLPANGESRVNFKIVAASTIAAAKVSVNVNALGENFSEVIEIAVRPPSTLQKLSGSGSIASGATQKINPGSNDFMPGTQDYKLVVSRSPVVELGEHLTYLVQYPYGCTEQTISAAFPQIYFGDLAELIQKGKKDSPRAISANANIIEAIRKIKMRQLYSGAITLWDGEAREDWWSSIYATHFLLEARKAGFDVENSLLETLLGYINNRLKTKELIPYYYNRNQNRKIAPKEVAYSLYVLTLAGRSNVPAMNYYKSNQSVLALDSRYLLAAAYAYAGDKKSFATMLPASFSGEESVPQTGGSYYSDVRDESIALNSLLEVDPANKQIPEMIKHVVAKLKGRRYLSTQERAFAFLALGKHARSVNNSSVTGEVKIGGKVIAKIEGGEWSGDMKTLDTYGANPSVELTAKGSGRLYYFWQAEGVSSTGAYKEEDSYIKVRRTFYDRTGKVIASNQFRQNDLIIVGIRLDRSYDNPVENIVITDILPAGFEIENPRTKEIPGMDWIKDATTPTALDVRDDRIHFFVDATYNSQTYYYAVRAVSTGSFKMGPVSADAMYNNEYHSYHGAGKIIVK